MSKIRAIDIRYNLEYIGMKKGIKKQISETKINYSENYDKKRIQKDISVNGCPDELNNFILQKFVKQCNKPCDECWKQEAK